MMSQWWSKTWVRMAAMIVVGLVFGAVVSEFTFWSSSQNQGRESHEVVLTIPAGTAQKLEQGTPLSIPEKMTFVEGDVLIVRNQDAVSHQLGPVWVPAQTSGVLQIGKSNLYSYECSFTPSKFFGLDVQPPLTWAIRLQGIISFGLPTGVILALYVLAAMPGSSSGPVREA